MESPPRPLTDPTLAYIVYLTVTETGSDPAGHWFHIPELQARFHTRDPSPFRSGDTVRIVITKDPRANALPI